MILYCDNTELGSAVTTRDFYSKLQMMVKTFRGVSIIEEWILIMP